MAVQLYVCVAEHFQVLAGDVHTGLGPSQPLPLSNHNIQLGLTTHVRRRYGHLASPPVENTCILQILVLSALHVYNGRTTVLGRLDPKRVLRVREFA